MPVDRLVNINGKKWGVTNLISPSVFIPIDEIEGISDSDIGRMVRELVHVAQIEDAREVQYEHMLNQMDTDWLIAIRQIAEQSYDSPYYQDETELVNLISDIEEALDFQAAEAERESRRQSKDATSKLPTGGYVYLLQSPTGAYKIGRAKDVSKRMSIFHVKLPFEVELLHTIKCADYIATESKLHARFASKRVNGEWFKLDEQDVEYIKSITQM